MMRAISLIVTMGLLTGCGGDFDEEPDPYDLDFDIPRTERFAPSLSAYDLYQEPIASLLPVDGALVYELSSELFTDYAFKQRLLRVPEGQTITQDGDGELAYPEGTLFAKTFYYPLDMRDTAGDTRVIETRLLVKNQGVWNVATYLWNDEQTEATLLLEGTRTDIAWIDQAGQSRSTSYAVPHEGECVTCHQAGGASVYIGPSLRNLNRAVTRDDSDINQLSYLESQGVLAANDWASAPTIPNYKDTDLSPEARARAYLDINCAHCHNPDAWDESSSVEVDFRWSTPLAEAGLSRKKQDLIRQLEEREMPFLGTTILHEEGVKLVLDYVQTLPDESR